MAMSSPPRFPRHRMHWDAYITPAVRNIVLICTGVYIVELIARLFYQPALVFMLTELGLVPLAVTHGLRLWQPVTYLFLHDPNSLFHLLLNMLFFWMFGVDLERSWGRRRFYEYFFITGIGAALINVLVKTILDPRGVGTATVPTIGASGAIYGILLAAAIMFPDRKMWLIPFPVTIPMKIYVLGAGAIEFFSTLGATGDNVSHVTHLGGMLVGYLYLRRGSFFYRMRNGVSDWQKKRARKKFQVYMGKHRNDPPPPPDRWVN